MEKMLNSSPADIEANWKEQYLKQLNETAATRAEGLSVMKRLITENHGMKTVQSDEFLLRFLRARKFNYEKAFKLLENYLRRKEMDPELFSTKQAVEDVVHLGEGWQCVLKGRSRKGEGVIVCRPGRYSLISNKSKRGDGYAVTVEEAFRTNVLAVEWLLLSEMSQLAGVVAIVDLAGFSLFTHALFLNPYHSKRTTNVVQDTIPLRFGGFHVVNQPKYIDAIYALFRPFLKEKVQQRVHFHGKCFERLHEYISPEVLPKEYGGKCGTEDDLDWKERLLADADRILAFEPPE